MPDEDTRRGEIRVKAGAQEAQLSPRGDVAAGLARQLPPSSQGATGLGGAGRAVAVGLPLVLLMGPLTAGLFRFIRNACAHAEPEVFDLFWGFRAAAGRSIASS